MAEFSSNGVDYQKIGYIKSVVYYTIQAKKGVIIYYVYVKF